jgi:hypothetical protein
MVVWFVRKKPETKIKIKMATIDGHCRYASTVPMLR